MFFHSTSNILRKGINKLEKFVERKDLEKFGCIGDWKKIYDTKIEIP